MAITGDPIKQFECQLFIEGVLVGSAEDYTLPKVEIETAEHSEGNQNKRTPGKIKTGDLVLKRLMRHGNSNSFWLWLFSARSYDGGGSNPLVYERNGQLLIGTESYDVVRFWVKALDPGSANTKGSDNMILEITFDLFQFKSSGI